MQALRQPAVSPSPPQQHRQRVHRYVCSSVPDHGGCGHLTVAAELVEKLLTDAVLAWSS